MLDTWCPLQITTKTKLILSIISIHVYLYLYSLPKALKSYKSIQMSLLRRQLLQFLIKTTFEKRSSYTSLLPMPDIKRKDPSIKGEKQFLYYKWHSTLYSVSQKKETGNIKLFTKYNFHHYKVHFIFFLMTQNIRCNDRAWPSKNNVKCQCQNQVVQNKCSNTFFLGDTVQLSIN